MEIFVKAVAIAFILSFGRINTVTAQVYETSAGHVEFDSSVPLHSFTGRSERYVLNQNSCIRAVPSGSDLPSIVYLDQDIE